MITKYNLSNPLESLEVLTSPANTNAQLGRKYIAYCKSQGSVNPHQYRFANKISTFPESILGLYNQNLGSLTGLKIEELTKNRRNLLESLLNQYHFPEKDLSLDTEFVKESDVTLPVDKEFK